MNHLFVHEWLLTHFKRLVSFYSPLKHHKLSHLFRGTEREKWDETNVLIKKAKRTVSYQKKEN